MQWIRVPVRNKEQTTRNTAFQRMAKHEIEIVSKFKIRGWQDWRLCMQRAAFNPPTWKYVDASTMASDEKPQKHPTWKTQLPSSTAMKHAPSENKKNRWVLCLGC